MTDFHVDTAAELSSALDRAVSGDTIHVAAGHYGDVTIRQTFSQDVTIVSSDPSHAATFHSLSINSSSGLTFDNIHVDFTPTSTTTSFSSAVKISNSDNITFKNGEIEG